MIKQKFVLAYSGGLDTSVILAWLKENYNCEVIAACIDVGQGDDFEAVRKKALSTGASKIYIEDVKNEFVKDYIFPTLKAGAVYEGKYLLGTSFARPVIAKKLVEIAHKENASTIVHGCTGKGNDQVRFELSIKALDPFLKVIAPWRIWDICSRDDEIDYAISHNIPVPVTKEKPYSMDKNLWHLSHEGGDLENPWNQHDMDMYEMVTPPEECPDNPSYVDLYFEKGIPTKINGVHYSPVDMINKLNEIGGQNGIGIADMVENRLVGMKSRGVYETPGGTILYAAHRELESITLDKQTFHYKEIMAQKYSELVYDGLWFTPIREALDAFVDSTQEFVTGTVKLKLYKGLCSTAGIKSPYSLYSEEFATFGKDEVYSQKDSEGFINLFGLPLKIRALMNMKSEEQEELKAV